MLLTDLTNAQFSDVVLKVIKIEEPVSITSRKTGKDYVVMNINCANDRGDIVRVNAWGREIDAIQPRLVLNSVIFMFFGVSLYISKRKLFFLSVFALLLS